VNDCEFTILLEEEHSFKMRLLKKPEGKEFSLSVRLPYNERGDKLLKKLSPVLRWSTQVYDYKWAHGGSKPREVCGELQRQVTIRQGSHKWLLDGVVPNGAGYTGEAGAPRDVSEIRFDFKYSACMHLERPARA